MSRGIVQKIVDDQLLSITPFDEILSSPIIQFFDWTEETLFNYIDVIFRFEHHEFYKEHLNYFLRGLTPSQIAQSNEAILNQIMEEPTKKLKR